MLSALASGQIVRAPKTGTSASGTRWCNATIRVPCGQDREGAAVSAFVTVLAFNDVADRLSRLGQGDSVAVQGPLKQTTYQTKDGETRHGLELLAQSLLTPYDLRKRRGDDRASRDKSTRSAPHAPARVDFDDEIAF